MLKLLFKYKTVTTFIVMGLTILSLSYLLKESNQEKKRFESNQHSLLEKVDYFKAKSGKNASEVEKLTLTNKEFKEHEKELVSKLEDLNLKVKRLQSASETAIETKYIVKTQIKDSLVYIEGKTIELKCVDFHNEWLTVNGCVKEGVFEGLIQSRDTLSHLVHRVPKRFLFIKYGTKGINLSVLSSNPYSKITYSKYIELKR